MTSAPEGYVPGYRSKVAPSQYEEIFRRVYAGEKCKHIAPEYGVSGRTLQRIVKYMAAELGVPMRDWAEMKARRRKEGWEFILEVWKHRDQEALIAHAEEERESAELQRRMQVDEERVRGEERASRAERQRRLDAINKRRNGWA